MRLKSLFILVVSSVVLASCNDWLDVSSKTEFPSEELFSSETGFKDAVIGVYVKLSKPELYGKNLTWHVNEFVSQNYAVVSGADDLNVPEYEYTLKPFVDYRNNIWKNCYELISNINNILRYEERNKDVMNPISDSLVRGELLGIRAMVHFDLLRMFGKGNLGGRPELLNKLSIPYSLDFSKNIPEQVTYQKYLELLRKDLEEAIRYLYADPFNQAREQSYYNAYKDSPFAKHRPMARFRMNYYAVQALYARMLMWEGTEEAKNKALTIAENLINHASYRWVAENAVVVKAGEWWKSNLLFNSEHLFSLGVEKLVDFESWFNASSPGTMYNVIFLTKSKALEIYEAPGIGDADWRFTECLLPQGSSLNNYALVKLREDIEYIGVDSKMLPLIRITEMYYIAAECRMETGTNYDKGKALEYLNTVREHRGIAKSDQLPETLGDKEMKNEIYKEYRKEFVGEGQMFFYYKRKGMEKIPGYSALMDDTKYQYPMPDDELLLGGRKTE